MDDSSYTSISGGTSASGGNYAGHLRVDGSWGPIGSNTIGQLLFVGYSDASDGTVQIGPSATLGVGGGLNGSFSPSDTYYDYWDITDFSTQALYPGVFIGYGAGSTGTLNLFGTLNVVDALGVKGKVYVAYGSGSVGYLNITEAGATMPGTVNADAIEFGAGTGSLTVHTSNGYTLAADMSGNGTLAFHSDTTADIGTTLTGDSSGFTGSASVVSGTLDVSGSLGGTLSVASAAILQGGGSVGDVTVDDGGILSGTSGSQLVFASLVLSDTSEVQVSLAGTPGTALFDVAGDFTLDGLLSVSAMTDTTYRLFSYGGTLTDNGITLDSVPAGFNAGDWAISAGAGLVSLYRASADAIQYWDGGSAVGTSAEGGDGTWNSSNTNWTNADGNVNGTWASGKASFGVTGGTVTVDGTQTFTGLVFEVDGYSLANGTAGELAIDGATSAAPITVDTGTATIGVAIAGATGGIAKMGTGTLVLTAANTYGGLTTVQDGSLELSGDGDIASSSGVDVGAGTTFDVSGVTATSTAIGSLAGSGTVDIGDRTLVTDSGTDSTFSGTLTGTGILSKQGTGVLTLSGTGSDFTELDIADGKVTVNSTTALNDGVAVTLSSGGQLTLGTGVAETLATLAGSTGTTVALGGNTLTVAGDDDGVFSGTISGTGALVKSGLGTLTLEGTNTWSGTTGTTRTTVSEGTLAIDNGGSISHANNTLVVGNVSGKAGALDIIDGSVTNRGGIIADVSGSVGEVHVGASGTWTNSGSSGNLVVGKGGDGLLDVSGGGTVTANLVTLGQAASSSGLVVVSGSGSTLTASSKIVVGFGGIGSLTVSDGGEVSAQDPGTGYEIEVGSGQIEIGADWTDDAAAAGTLSVNAILLQSYDSYLDFNHTETSYVFSSYVEFWDAGTITNWAGTTELSGEIVGGGFIDVEGGTLTISYSNSGYYGEAGVHAGVLALAGADVLGSGIIDFCSCDSGTLRLEGNFALGASIGGLDSADWIDLQAMTFDDGAVDASFDDGTGTLTITQSGTGATASLDFMDFFGVDLKFVASEDTDGSTLVRVRFAPSDLDVDGGGTLQADEFAADGAVVGTLVATDPDSASFTFTLTDDAGGRFAIDSTTGEVTVANGLLLDYEQVTSHDIEVQVTNDVGLSYTETFTVTVGDINPENVTGDATANTFVGGADRDTLDGQDGNDTLIGGAGRDTLQGGNGDDLLDGGSGADAMAGGDGDDVYYVNQSGDVVTEAANEGMDKVVTRVSYTLGSDVEHLKLAGSSALAGTGNGLGNAIRGNEAANTVDGKLGNDSLWGEGGNDSLLGDDGHDVLNGGNGDDTLGGGDGNDTLRGDAGDDSMEGGLGDDSYVVEQPGDLVVEAADAGRDTVYSGISYTLTDNVEVLRMTGNAAIEGTGNGLDNRLEGNSAANALNGLVGQDTLSGGAGSDTLVGGDGHDALYGGNDDDTLQGDDGNDLLRGDAGNDALEGGAGDDRLLGDAGDDTLAGGDGNDKLWGGMDADTFTFSDGSGKDRIEDFSHADGDRIGIDADVNGSGIMTAADALAAVTYVSGNAVLHLGTGHSVKLVGVASGLVEADFVIYSP